MWLDQDIQDHRKIEGRRGRSINVEPESAPPFTPRLRERLPELHERYALAMAEGNTLDELLANARSIADWEHEAKRERIAESNVQKKRIRGREKRRQIPLDGTPNSETVLPTSDSGKQVFEMIFGSRRRSRSQGCERSYSTISSDEAPSRLRPRKHAHEEESGVSLKPLTSLPPTSEERIDKPAIARRRGTSTAKIAADQVHHLQKEEVEWMTDDPIIRGYAETSQEGLYAGFGIDDMARTPMLQRYAEPNRDKEEINRIIYNMTVNDHEYRIGGPPSPVDIYNTNYHSNVNEVRGHAEFGHARQAKAFAAYVMFTERQEEIDMLHRMKVHGYLKDGIDIRYGYQEIGPHGSIAWLTHAGQEIGGREREDYEWEKSIEGTLKSFFLLPLAKMRAKLRLSSWP